MKTEKYWFHFIELVQSVIEQIIDLGELLHS